MSSTWVICARFYKYPTNERVLSFPTHGSSELIVFLTVMVKLHKRNKRKPHRIWLSTDIDSSTWKWFLILRPAVTQWHIAMMKPSTTIELIRFVTNCSHQERKELQNIATLCEHLFAFGRNLFPQSFCNTFLIYSRIKYIFSVYSIKIVAICKRCVGNKSSAQKNMCFYFCNGTQKKNPYRICTNGLQSRTAQVCALFLFSLFFLHKSCLLLFEEQHKSDVFVMEMLSWEEKTLTKHINSYSIAKKSIFAIITNVHGSVDANNWKNEKCCKGGRIWATVSFPCAL